MFARAERPEVTSPAVATGRPDEPAERTPRRTGRSPQLVGIMVAALCVSACQSTTVPGLNVRAGPSTSSKIVAKMNSAGSAVYIECYTRGQSINGQTMWYRITAPHRGYVTAYYVRADANDVLRAC